ncbi:cation:proton antiporter subunit C [Solemya velum gill symbiont]|uniref:Na+/H+ antiporter subunit C n=1 Tax=Solemya velum gill symbiont TaxID=2340 RepID=A0A0B0HED2_SOVGS|nr:cation:proton antiporter subunit C [Solemya velum gill symbiont]KHF25811.1 Na+:H+ antiporter MrpEFGBBCDD, subunit C [Solemya velum gill symbiont]OOY34517.1 Na+/H+ antiporter subunit C [Solemya velum gill symbiont]OOY37232.1 Na+/H+ antiporter subunit C [Solemya velum gill symbiont]OOY38997.1 Na+/H+ antiporter subunit C [Solemya velum gill symbiont]OOY42369.1 Na+/H+ antiporter subunit C [Solemya velum gill symbiont]
MNDLLGLYSYWIVIVLMMAGFYVVISSSNLIKKIAGLNIFQTSVFILYISMGKVDGGTAPIVVEGSSNAIYSNPLPHVLILTAIVVGVATTALALALVVRIKEAYGTVDEEAISESDNEL